ncbi:FAD-dependent monooxygenase [Candidatus Curculioniphilus buchneri]|uniref:FAD-dependent monooxygenase n=1 Tax=Candidatus Curculioniphilus buchneri TaxID=690594 RepID=UPI00376EAB4B
MQEFDIVINGGGMIGLSLACGLQESGLRVAIIESHIPTLVQPNRPILRVSAINFASCRLLQYVQVWKEIIAHGANAYHKIEVWEKDNFGKIMFDSLELSYPQLGYIVENSIIQQTLWCRAKQLNNIILFSPAELFQIVWRKTDVLLILKDGKMLTARLVVAADGAHSWIRQYVGIPLIFWDYQHHSLVATVRTELPHRNIARQAFCDDSILAFLPLSNPHLSSIVWSLPPEIAQQYLIQSVEKFNMALAMCFSLTLGLCELQGERKTFSLVGRYARHFATHRLVLLGDAAHTIHPLGGQGINLGLMDVMVFLGELQRLKALDKDIGCYSYLRHYECIRQHGNALMLMSMQGLQELFSGHNPIKKWIRNQGLQIVNTLPGIKSCLIRQAMGLNDLPDWLAEKSFN